MKEGDKTDTDLALCVLGIVGLIFWTYFNHKREKTLIEKGLYKPPKPLEVTKKILITGLILAGIGAAISIGIYWEAGLCIWMIGGLIPSFIGIALLISYLFIREK